MAEVVPAEAVAVSVTAPASQRATTLDALTVGNWRAVIVPAAVSVLAHPLLFFTVTL
jgi:hypothetical protein